MRLLAPINSLQMLAGLLLLEILSIGLFAAILTEQQTHRVLQRRAILADL